MDETTQGKSLGQRIVEAARLAATMHLAQFSETVDSETDSQSTLRQLTQIGRADRFAGQIRMLSALPLAG